MGMMLPAEQRVAGSPRLIDIVVSSGLAGIAGGLAVMAFTRITEAAGYTAETSGQVAVGTVTYGVIRQVIDVLLTKRTQRELRYRVSGLLTAYARHAQTRDRIPRHVASLEQDIVELRGHARVSDRDDFDLALGELRGHGTTGEFSNLDDDVPVLRITDLARKLR